MKRMMLLLGCIFALGLFSCKTDDEEVCILVNDSEMITALEVGQPVYPPLEQQLFSKLGGQQCSCGNTFLNVRRFRKHFRTGDG